MLGIDNNTVLMLPAEDFKDSRITEQASLKEVMDELEKISYMDLSNIDIIVQAELPLVVKNNQIVLISNAKPSKITVGDYVFDSYEFSENEMLVTFLHSQSILGISSGIKKIDVPVGKAYQKIGDTIKSIEGYIGVDNTWVKFSQGDMKLYLNGKENYTDLVGLFKITLGEGNGTYSHNATLTKGTSSMIFDCYYGGATNTAFESCFAFQNKIDFTSYNLVRMKFSNLRVSQGGGKSYVELCLAGTSKGGSKVVYARTTNSVSELVLDVSSVIGEYYLCLYGYHYRQDGNADISTRGTITEITLE